MNSGSPQVDVVIAVRNGMPFIREAIQSALNQLNVSIKVTVVDDGSDDGTADEILSLSSDSIQVLTGHARESAAAGRNRGVIHSNSEWISFLDADDLWPPGRTEKLIRLIENQVFAISYGRSVQFGSDDTYTELESMVPQNSMKAVCIGGTVFSRSTFEKVGLLNTELQVGEFVEWFARARELGIKEYELPIISLFRRSHARNTSRERHQAYKEDYLSIIKSHRHRLRTEKAQNGNL